MKTAIIAAALLATACAAPPPPRDKAADDAAIRAAVMKKIECSLDNVGQVDDGISDATTVALALSFRCANEYDAATEAMGATLQNNVQRQGLRERMATTQMRVQSFLPIVMDYRNKARQR